MREGKFITRVIPRKVLDNMSEEGKAYFIKETKIALFAEAVDLGYLDENKTYTITYKKVLTFEDLIEEIHKGLVWNKPTSEFKPSITLIIKYGEVITLAPFWEKDKEN